MKGWWNLVSQSFPINKRLLVVVRVCTVSSLLYTNNFHPHDSPPTLASHWSARSADCPLIGQPHVSGSGPGGKLEQQQVWQPQCSIPRVRPGLDWTDCCTLDCSAQTSSRRTISPPWIPLEEFASITFLCSQIYGQNSKIRYKVII